MHRLHLRVLPRLLVILTAMLIIVRSDASTAPAEPKTLLILGDSLSAGYGIRPQLGWVALLTGRLQDKGYGYHVVNASVSGETTAGGLARLPHLLQLHHPDAVLVELGGNDGLRGLPIEDIRENLAKITQQTLRSGAKVILVGIRVPANYGPQYSEQFAGLFMAIAKKEHVACVPFLLEKIALTDKYFQADQLHPTEDAQPLLLDTVWPVLFRELPGSSANTATAH